MTYERKIWPTIQMPPVTVHAKHPFKNRLNHEKLLDYVKQRLDEDLSHRQARAARYSATDKDVAGWILADVEDKKRKAKKAKNGTPAPVKVNLPLTYVHIADMMTYFATTFAPNRGMFYHTAEVDDSESAAAFVSTMNNDAIYTGAYRDTLATIFNLLKHNTGGFHAFWDRDYGPRLDVQNGVLINETELRWSGNRFDALDVYNLIHDPYVHPTQVYQDGEYAGYVKLRSQYWLMREASQGRFFNCGEALDRARDGVMDAGISRYYIAPPKIFDGTGVGAGGTDWIAVLAANEGTMLDQGHELATLYIRINPTDFDLVPAKDKVARNRLELWRITILNQSYVIEAEYINSVHNKIPVLVGVINDDLVGPACKSPAEVLSPLQDFASHSINAHVGVNRRNLHGLIVYDPNIVDLSELPDGEVIGRMPAKPGSAGRLNEGIWQQELLKSNGAAMQDVERIMALINQFFPTQALPMQIAGIDRAVTNQVAAVQQGTNRRNQTAARLIDEILFRPLRFILFYNRLQYQEEDQSDIVDFYTGLTKRLDLSAIRQSNLPLMIGQGLKSLDRMQAAELLKEVIFTFIQTPQAAQVAGVNLVKLLDYWTSMLDIDINMSQFVNPQSSEPAAAPTGQPGGTLPDVEPAMNPLALGQPVFGQ